MSSMQSQALKENINIWEDWYLSNKKKSTYGKSRVQFNYDMLKFQIIGC